MAPQRSTCAHLSHTHARGPADTASMQPSRHRLDVRHTWVDDAILGGLYHAGAVLLLGQRLPVGGVGAV